MLAQNFMSAADLDITEPQRQALIKNLALIETGKLTHTSEYYINEDYEPKFTGKFNMAVWAGKSDCGTVCCIGGTAELIGDVDFSENNLTHGLANLFFAYGRGKPLGSITLEESAIALRSYLTTGHPRWDLAVA